MKLIDLAVYVLAGLFTVFAGYYGITLIDDARTSAKCAKLGEVFNGKTKFEAHTCFGEIAPGVYRPIL